MNKSRSTFRTLLVLLAVLSGGCGDSTPPYAPPGCVALAETPWVPQISDTLVSSSNHDNTVSINTESYSATAKIIGLSQPAPATVETTIEIPMTADLGAFGSLTLVASVSGFPSDLQGGAFPMLVSLDDGTNDYIRLTRNGTGGDCAQSGYYTCSAGRCVENTNCSVSLNSAYVDRIHWEQHQAPNSMATNSPSTNTFPTCNWTDGNISELQPPCAFNSTFFDGAQKLKHGSGVKYTAKYVLVSDSYASIPSARTATITVKAIKKTDNSSGGAIDLNVIFVGNKTINDSRTNTGKRNLNTLFTDVANLFAQTGTNVKIGSINPIEWTCANGAEEFSNVKLSSLSEMFSKSGSLAPQGSEGKALNIFFVSSISDDSDSVGSQYTILGFDGAINGPPIYGTAVSGVTIATLDDLAQLNPGCGDDLKICSKTQQDSDFNRLGIAIAHEIGHYFGLNHLSEGSPNTIHPTYSNDLVSDTPICTQIDGGDISIISCLNHDTNNQPPAFNKTCSDACAAYSPSSGVYCANIIECSFNYVMWWTTKNFSPQNGQGDGNMLSPNSGKIINYHPLIQ